LLDRIARLAQHLRIFDGIDFAVPAVAQIGLIPNLIIVDTIPVAQRQRSSEVGELECGGWRLKTGRRGPQRRSIEHGDEIEIAAILHNAIPLGPIELSLLRLDLRPWKRLADPIEARLFDLRKFGLKLRGVVLFQRDVHAYAALCWSEWLGETEEDSAHCLRVLFRNGNCRAADHHEAVGTPK
jgi:hypothetical protein